MSAQARAARKKRAEPLTKEGYLLQSGISLWYHSPADLAMRIGRATPGETRNFPVVNPV
jgi:hypothetical protein